MKYIKVLSKTQKILVATRITALVLLSSSLVFLFGCEGTDSPPHDDLEQYFANNPYASDPRGQTINPVKVSPSTATVQAVGQQVVITARGGAGPYTWDVSIPANGTISTSSNWRQAVYTATTLNLNSVIVYDRKGHAAIATIRPPTGQQLSINASPGTIEVDGGTSVLDASGGVPPYNWTVSNADRGVISATTGNSVVYTRVSHGNNSVQLVDQNGTVANVIITQPE